MIDYGEENGGDLRTDATYYAIISSHFPRENPMGLVRRRVVDGYNRDEAFTRNKRWESDSYLALHDAGYREGEHVEIHYEEAKALIPGFLEAIEKNEEETAVRLAAYYAEHPEHAP